MSSLLRIPTTKGLLGLSKSSFGGGVFAGTAPSEISGLVLWLDSTAIVGKTNGETITLWTDQSGQGNNAAEATNPPTYDDGSSYYENKPGVLFNTTAERLDVPASVSLALNECTYICIARYLQVNVNTAGSDSTWLFNKNNTNPSTFSLRTADDGFEGFYRREGFEGSAVTLSAGGNCMIDQAVNMHVMRAGLTSADYKVSSSAGGLKTVKTDSYASSGIDTDNNGILSIGNHPTTNNFSNVPRIIYHMIAYNRVLSDTEIDELRVWFENQFTSEWVKQGELFPGTNYYSCSIFIDGSTAYLTYVASNGISIGYMTANTADPHNWTDQGTIFTAGAQCRTARLLKSGSTWYLYYDDRAAGDINVATGATIGVLADYGSNPVLAGSGTEWETYVRHPYVIAPSEAHDTNWHMLYDGRDTSPTSGIGAVGHATSSDGLNWTRDTANNPVIDVSGLNDFEDNDITYPSMWYDSVAGKYHVFYAGYWSSFASKFPHHIGSGTSNDLSTIVKNTSGNPILPISQDSTDFDCIAQVSPAPYVPDGLTLNLYYAGFDGTTNYYLGRASRRNGIGP